MIRELEYGVRQGDCLAALPALPDNSIDLILTDPPYFRVKGNAWDNQWESPQAFLSWIGLVLAEFQRVLKPNGSLYLFASPQMAARVECKVGETFNVLNHLVWRKENGHHKAAGKDALRGYFPQTERIIFAEHFGADNMAKGEDGYAVKCDELRGFLYEPLRTYLEGERLRSGTDKIACNVACGFSASAGGMASRHYFSRSQWQMPTPEHYAALQVLFNAHGGEFLRREYEDLRREYEDLRREYEDLRREYEDLRRPFGVSADVPYTDVWDTFAPVQAYPGKHVCEKPQALLRHIIAASSRPGAVVLDAFAGSGSTGRAAQSLGRKFIGIELDEAWAQKAADALSCAVTFAAAAPPSFRTAPLKKTQPTLFDFIAAE